jgi:hypothetical protein
VADVQTKNRVDFVLLECCAYTLQESEGTILAAKHYKMAVGEQNSVRIEPIIIYFNFHLFTTRYFTISTGVCSGPNIISNYFKTKHLSKLKIKLSN